MNKIAIEMVEDLLLALKSDDDISSKKLLAEITHLNESRVVQQVEEIAQNLHATMAGFGEDAEILLQAKHDIPDVSERLEYVIKTTEDASNKTLLAAENAMVFLGNMQAKLGNDTIVSQELDEIKSQLTEIMMSQSFQDLTGQVLKRVMFLVGSLEASLVNLIEKSGVNYANIPNREVSDADKKAAEMRGIGPNVTKKSQENTATSQADVDDLLGDLGI